MLDTSVLGELTADACAAVTGRQDAAALLRSIDAASLFLVPLDEDRTSFRYHHLVRQLLRAELRARDRTREQALQLRAAEWFESMGDTRRAARHFLAARQADRALALLQDRVVTDFLRDPALPPPLDLSTVPASLLAAAPDRLLGLAIDLLLSGDIARAGEYLDLLERAQPSPRPTRGWRPGSRWRSPAPHDDRPGGGGGGRGPGRPGHPGTNAGERRLDRRHPHHPAAHLHLAGRPAWR